jgi:AraC-like DNA-binding protein
LFNGQILFPLLLVPGNPPYKYEQHRVEKHPEYGRDKHASQQGNPHDLSGFGTSPGCHDQRKNTQDKGKGGHQDGPETVSEPDQEKIGNVAEITLEVGFNNRSYFAKCFKELYGSSQSDYVKV